MNDIVTRPAEKMSREELYELVWQTPMSKLGSHASFCIKACMGHVKKPQQSLRKSPTGSCHIFHHARFMGIIAM